MLARSIHDLVSTQAEEPPRRSTVSIDGLTVRMARIKQELVVTIHGSFGPTLTMGRPDPSFDIPIGLLDGLPIWGMQSEPSPADWLADGRNLDLLEALRLTSADNLMIAVNVIDLRGPADPAAPWEVRVERLALLAKAIAVPFEPDPGIAGLIELGVARDVAERWTISDDSLRGEAMEQATARDLERLIAVTAAAWPRLQPLVRGVGSDSTGGMAGLLTDAAQEAEIELHSRSEAT